MQARPVVVPGGAYPVERQRQLEALQERIALQAVLPGHQSCHVSGLQAEGRQRRIIGNRAVVGYRIGARRSGHPFRIVDEEVIHLGGGVDVVFAQEDALGDPVQQAVGQHQVVGEVLVAVEGLGQVLPSVTEVVDGGKHVTRTVSQQRGSRAAGKGRINRRIIDG